VARLRILLLVFVAGLLIGWIAADAFIASKCEIDARYEWDWVRFECNGSGLK
jgi:hypothetical protein